MWTKYFYKNERSILRIIKGTVDSKILKLNKPDSVKYIRKQETIGIIGGEFAITYDIDNMPISTLLGSCVAVMLYDGFNKVKAMNHFLLPNSCYQNESCRFGLYAMESMLNEMYKLGCDKNNITAKIAGGATILQNFSKSIGEKNVTFARDFCRSENIKIISESVFGNYGRIVMLGNEFKTISRNVSNRTIEERITYADKSLADIINKTETVKSKKEDIILF